MHGEGLSLDYFQHSNPISHLPISLHKVSYYRWQWKWQWASLLLDARVWRIGESINAKRIIFWLGTAAHCFHLLLYSNERRRESLQIGFLLMHKIFQNIPRKSYFYNFASTAVDCVKIVKCISHQKLLRFSWTTKWKWHLKAICLL